MRYIVSAILLVFIANTTGFAQTEAEAYVEARLRIAQNSLTHATELNLGDINNLTEIPPEIAELTHLKALYINQLACKSYLNCQRGSLMVADLTPIAGLTGLEYLNISGTQVADLSPLSGLVNLQSLWMNYTNVRDLSPISRLPGLNSILAQNTQIQDLSPLAEASDLIILELSLTSIDDLSPLSQNQKLWNLSIVGTLVEDLSPVTNFNNLLILNIAGSKVRDLSAVLGLDRPVLIIDDLALYDPVQIAHLRDAGFIVITFEEAFGAPLIIQK